MNQTSGRGSLRVIYWGTLYSGIAFANLALSEFQPQWWVLGILSALWIVLCIRPLKDIATLREGLRSTVRSTKVLLFVGALLATIVLLGAAFLVNESFALQIAEFYLFPSLGVCCLAFVLQAWRTERKRGVHVYVGNDGWVFVKN